MNCTRPLCMPWKYPGIKKPASGTGLRNIPCLEWLRRCPFVSTHCSFWRLCRATVLTPASDHSPRAGDHLRAAFWSWWSESTHPPVAALLICRSLNWAWSWISAWEKSEPTVLIRSANICGKSFCWGKKFMLCSICPTQYGVGIPSGHTYPANQVTGSSIWNSICHHSGAEPSPEAILSMNFNGLKQDCFWDK